MTTHRGTKIPLFLIAVLALCCWGGLVSPATATHLNYSIEKLLASDGAATDLFGEAVSVSGDGNTLVVGASLDDDQLSAAGAYSTED